MKFKRSGATVPPIIGSDANSQETTEQKAIDSINRNKRKGFAHNNDAAGSDADPSSEPPASSTAPATIIGSDSESTSTEPAPTAPAPTQAPSGIDISQLEGLFKSAIEDALKPLKTELSETKEQLSQAQQQLSDRAGEQEKIIELFNGNTGNPNPSNTDATGSKPVNVNTKFGVGDGLSGAAKDFADILTDSSKTPARLYVDSLTNQRYIQRDYRNLTRFWREQRDSVRKDMETYAKKSGLLQGWRSADFLENSGSDAATLKTDIPDAFLAYLSTVVRETHSPNYIYYQFAFNRLELGKGEGDTIKVARFSYLPTASTIGDRQLTPGTPTTSNNQNLTAGAVTVVLEELGLGKGAGSEPVAIPEFISAYSLLELEGALQNRIGHDHEDYTDFRHRALLNSTTRVVYNSRGSVVTAPGSIVAGTAGDKETRSGGITPIFLNNLYAYMHGLKIPTYQNGKYALCLHTTALAQLKNSMMPTSFEMDGTTADIANLFNAANAGEMERISGYHGDVCGFMVFSTNAHSLGAAGTEGAQNETILSVPTLTRTSFAFGRNPYAEAIGMPMEVRRDNNDDFGRLNRYIWIKHAGYQGLDIDPARSGGSTNEQLRVIRLNSTDSWL